MVRHACRLLDAVRSHHRGSTTRPLNQRSTESWVYTSHHSPRRPTTEIWLRKEHPSNQQATEPCPQLASRHPLQFAFPDRPDLPSEPPQLAVVRDVACPVAFELREPVACVGLRQPALHAAVHVPEASPDLHDRRVFRQHDVRAAGEAPYMQPEPEAHRMEGTADPEFGARVLRPDAGHDCRPLIWRDPVCHGDCCLLPAVPISTGRTGGWRQYWADWRFRATVLTRRTNHAPEAVMRCWDDLFVFDRHGYE